MTDRGRVIRKNKGPRVRGETQVAVVITGPFICRVDPVEQNEVNVDGRYAKNYSHTMIAALDFIDGTPLEFDTKDVVVIEEGYLGSNELKPYGKFEIVAEMIPKPRNLNKDLLQVFKLTKLEEH